MIKEMETLLSPNKPSERVDEEARVELLLSEKLMDGYVLLEKCCPVCSTPLVKNHTSHNPAEDSAKDEDEHDVKPVLVPSDSFDQPFKPVTGVPFCVGCSSHVITQECEISILERCDSLKAKGSILVALQDNSIYTESAASRSRKEEIQAVPSKDPLTTAPSQEREPSPKAEQRDVVDVTNVDDKSTPDSAPSSSIEEDVAPQPIDAEPTQLQSLGSKPPRSSDHGDEKKEDEPADFEKQQETDEIMAEYSVRREIATKVLGAKMLQGYTLKETQCGKCGMPLMEFQSKLDCVVCPALVKKAKKKAKAQQRLAEETLRMEQEIEEAKARKAAEIEEARAKQAAEQKRAIEEAALAEQKQHLEEAKREHERREQEERSRLGNIEVEQAKLLAIEETKKTRIASLEAEEVRLLADARARAEEEARVYEQERSLSGTKATEKKVMLESLRKEKQLSINEEYLAASEKRRLEEIKLLEETKRLEDMESRRKFELVSATEAMKKDLLAQEHRNRLVNKAKLDEDILQLEQERLVEELEARKGAEDKRASEEGRMIAALELEATTKARAAEDAIRKAKAALEHVHSARRDIIAQTIAMAEQEAVAEAEGIIKLEQEDYKAPVILHTASEVQKERWETLRTEGRSIMTRRVMAGWSLLAEFCVGTECDNSPLITKNSKKECVVCGGCGDGADGAYDVSKSVDEDEEVTDVELARLRATGVHPDAIEESGYEVEPHLSPTANHTFEEIQQDFETKRNMVSKEIGKRMIQGWTLLDASCPHCVMPLMMDTKGNADICVLCGLVSTIQNNEGSTLKTESQPTVIVQFSSPPAAVEPVVLAPVVVAPIFTVPSVEETVPLEEHQGDAITMESTIPTLHQGDAITIESTIPSQHMNGSELPKAPTFQEKEKETPSIDLTDVIREQSARRAPRPSPKGDPPASFKSVPRKPKADPSEASNEPPSRKEAEVKTDDDGMTIAIPKNFDFSDQIAVQRLLDSAKSGNKVEEDHELDHIEVTGSGEIYTGKDAMSAEVISKMILRSPMGVDAQRDDNVNKEDIMDLVQIYVATNFSEFISTYTKKEIAQDIMKRMEAMKVKSPQHSEPVVFVEEMKMISPMNSEPLVIHLEDLPTPTSHEPKTFKFDMEEVKDEPAGPALEEASVRSSVSKRQKPTPENMFGRKPRTKRMPPRPDSTRSVACSRRPPRAIPRSYRHSPKSTGIVVVGGPTDFRDTQSLGDMSRAESVATEALDSILNRIESCKSTLLSDDADIKTQLAAADLIEKLARAAVAVKSLEKMDY